MRTRSKLIAGSVAAVAVVGIGAGVRAATGDDEPLQGNLRDRAEAAALDHVGGGTVTETEIGDGGAAYEVEVRLDNGRQVEVQLDEGFNPIGSETDDDGARDSAEGGEDD
jgi:hypothetical protein